MAEMQTAAILLNLYSLAIGFTVAALCGSAVPMLTGKPLRFEMPNQQSNLEMIIGCFCRIIAGPFLIIRNTLKAILITGREPYWVMMAIVLAGLWSYCQGVILIETMCQLGLCKL